MSETNEKHIKFRIQRIETLQFAKLHEEVNEDQLSFLVNFGFGIDPEAMFVRTTFNYELLSESKSCVIIEVAVDFEINPECFEEQFKKDGKLFIKKDFAIHLAVVTVGTARGILHEKIKESPLSKYPIPTVNVQGQITKDISIDN